MKLTILIVTLTALIRLENTPNPTTSNFYYSFATKDAGIENLHAQLLSRLKINPIFMNFKNQKSHCRISRSPFCEDIGNTYLRQFEMTKEVQERLEQATIPLGDSLKAVLAVLRLQMVLSNGGVFLLSLSELFSNLLDETQPTFLIDFDYTKSSNFRFEPKALTEAISEDQDIQISTNLELSKGLEFKIIISIQTHNFYVPSISLARSNRASKAGTEMEEDIWDKMNPSKESLQSFLKFVNQDEFDQGDASIEEFDPYGNYPGNNFICTMNKPGVLYLEEVKIISFYIKKLDINMDKADSKIVRFYHNDQLVLERQIGMTDYDWHLVHLEPPQLANKIIFPEKIGLDNIHIVTDKNVFKSFK